MPSNASGCFVAVRRERDLFRFMRLAYSYAILSNRIEFMPASVLRKQIEDCITVVEISYDI